MSQLPSIISEYYAASDAAATASPRPRPRRLTGARGGASEELPVVVLTAGSDPTVLWLVGAEQQIACRYPSGAGDSAWGMRRWAWPEPLAGTAQMFASPAPCGMA
ncbi:MAG: hypothetical protein QOH84_2093 [Kribbellaceae bacterium]|nr:hypothetical protein [Kribbellaceae bacterium]